MKKNLSTTALLLLFVLFVGCGLGIEPPDKQITAVLELTKANPTQSEIEFAAEALSGRFARYGNPPKTVEVDSEGRINFVIETIAKEGTVRNLMSTPGELSFYHIERNEEFMPFLQALDEILAKNDSIEENPLLSKIAVPGFPGAPNIFSVTAEDTIDVGQMLRSSLARQLLPRELRNTKFLWGRPDLEENLVMCYPVRTKGGSPRLDGKSVKQAMMSYDMADRPVINIELYDEGALVWEEMTGYAFQNRSQIAIVVDGVVYSAPGVTSGPIVGGRSQIAGGFTEEEARDLAMIIESGAIPVMTLLEFTSKPLE